MKHATSRLLPFLIRFFSEANEIKMRKEASRVFILITTFGKTREEIKQKLRESSASQGRSRDVVRTLSLGEKLLPFHILLEAIS